MKMLCRINEVDDIFLKPLNVMDGFLNFRI